MKVLNNFDKAFEFLMRYEGYKSNHPSDPGGRTVFGISERYHPETVKRIWDLPKTEAKEEAKIFYKREYWDRYKCDELPSKIDILIFDISVNPGTKLAEKLISIFNIFGLKKGETDRVLMATNLKRIKYYNDRVKENPKLKVFLHGWLNRCFDLMEYLVD
jgi:lysozyme family protein